jgi:hypothetical protein
LEREVFRQKNFSPFGDHFCRREERRNFLLKMLTKKQKTSAAGANFFVENACFYAENN